MTPSSALGACPAASPSASFQILLKHFCSTAHSRVLANLSTNRTGAARSLWVSCVVASVVKSCPSESRQCINALHAEHIDIGVCRSHKDLVKEAAPHYKKARKFYDGLAAELVQQGHALDVFACSLDQVWRCCLHHDMLHAVCRTGNLQP